MTAGNYRRPPVRYQFKKGQSGNPNGRPKKNRNVSGGPVGGGTKDRLAAMALEEATRPIAVREGDRVTSMPAMQAVIRSMFRLAAQGDAKTQRQLMDLIARVESDRAALAMSYLEAAINYKQDAEEIIRQHKTKGLPPPDFYPHPDDLEIDFHTGEVVIDGPLTKEQAGAQEAVRKISMKKLIRFFELQSALAEDPANDALKREMKELQKYKDFFERVSQRRDRLEALRRSREALPAKKTKPKEGKKEDKA
jgi:Family of unknown function (DUF5681)